MAKKPKIFLSPSNQPENLYAYGNTNERDVCKKIAEACKVALIRNGFEVKIAQEVSLHQKCELSNQWGADLHIPIHTNAFNKSVTGTRMFYYSNNSDGYDACKTIFNVLAPFTPGTSENYSKNQSLTEMAKTKAPAVYIEVDFHDVPKIAKWLIENTEAIGEKIAEGVCKHYKVTYKGKPAPAKIWRVQVGAYADKENANKLLQKLKKDGYDAIIV